MELDSHEKEAIFFALDTNKDGFVSITDFKGFEDQAVLGAIQMFVKEIPANLMR